MHFNLSESERRETGRRYIDAAEAWLRKIIHSQLSQAYGDAYFLQMVSAEIPIVPKKIREYAEKRMAEGVGQFSRLIDATTFGQAVTLILHPTLYPSFFKTALATAYPDGVDEARTFLTRLENIRNRLAHGSTCSVRELEQAIAD